MIKKILWVTLGLPIGSLVFVGGFVKGKKMYEVFTPPSYEISNLISKSIISFSLNDLMSLFKMIVSYCSLIGYPLFGVFLGGYILVLTFRQVFPIKSSQTTDS
ncbi:hypothetical protein G6702_06790 [Polynucleobacter paneuropaeus]|nr:hypothetical protein G6702_06790 [Polynucleobacter paneuropaeus]